MINATLGELADTHAAISAILALVLPSKTAYHVAKLSRLIMPEIQTFNAQRDAIVKRFGKEVPDTNGVNFIVGPESIMAYTAELNELAAVQVSIDWTPIPFSALEHQNVSGATILGLGPLLDDSK